jgi:hypothetical protein
LYPWRPLAALSHAPNCRPVKAQQFGELPLADDPQKGRRYYLIVAQQPAGHGAALHLIASLCAGATMGATVGDFQGTEED